jgi:FK506-binding protein 15
MIGTRYSGWLIEANNQIGALFDSNVNQKDSTASFKIRVGDGRVIKGWEEGVLGMKKGGKRVLVIPPELAYGKNGAPPSIPPNARLLFEVILSFLSPFPVIPVAHHQ